ncbi:MAG: hypothetical protein OXH57_05640 [Ekhidna sp.]|nr:hypothetical protein [Ekhidna sp.]
MPISKTDEERSIELFEWTKTYLQTGQNEIFYLKDIEYDLINKGISKKLMTEPKFSDSLAFLLHKHLNIDYLLFITVNSLKDGDSGYYFENELISLSQEKNTSIANITFLLVPSGINRTSHKFNITTKIAPLTKETKSGGEQRINWSNESMALSKAFMKGIKKIKKNMINNEI